MAQTVKTENPQQGKIADYQKRLIVAVVLVVLCFIIFFFFVYMPSKQQLDRTRLKLDALNASIGEITQAAGKDRPLEVSVEELQKQLIALEQKFPSQEEIVLRELPRFANSLGIEVISMTPQKVRKTSTIGGVPFKMKGYQPEEMQVAMNINCPYRMLGEYLDKLQGEFPTFVKINSVQMAQSNQKKAQPTLNITLNMEIYLLSKVGAEKP